MLPELVVLVLVIASQSLGLALMRLSHLNPPATANGPSDPRERSVRLWRFGAVLFGLSSIACLILPLMVLPLILVCVVQSSTCVINAALARILLKEPLTLSILGGMCFIGAGIGGVVYSSYRNGFELPISDPDLSLDELYTLLTRQPFVIWTSITLVLMFTLVYRQLINYPVKITGKHRDVEILGDSAPDAAWWASARVQQHAVTWAWALITGTAGAHAVMLGKLLLGVVMQNLPLKLVDLERLTFWILGVLGLGFFMVQMYGIAGGLRYASTTELYPRIYLVYTLVEMVNAVTLFGQPSPNPGLIIVGSSLLTVTGVFLVFQRFTEFSDNENGLVYRLGSLKFVGWIWQSLWQWISGYKPVSETVSSPIDPSPTSFPSLSTSSLASPRYDSLRHDSPVSPISAPLPTPRLSVHVPPPLHIPGSPQKHTTRNLTPKNLVTPPNVRLASSPSQAPPTFTPASPTHTQIDGDSLPLLSATTYTSFDSLSPSIVNPDKARGRYTRTVLSKEQHRILRELGM